MKENKEKLFADLSRQLNLPPEQIESSCKTGDADNLMKNLDSGTAAQVQSILSDPDKTRELLNSPQAQALIKLLDHQ